MRLNRVNSRCDALDSRPADATIVRSPQTALRPGKIRSVAIAMLMTGAASIGNSTSRHERPPLRLRNRSLSVPANSVRSVEKAGEIASALTLRSISP